MRDFLSRFHFNTKLLMLIIPPMIVIFYLTSNHAIKVYSDYESLLDVEHSMVVTNKMSTLIHELQIERGMSAAYISSQGSDFKEELLSQQKRVDKISEIKDISTIRARIMKLNISIDEEIEYYSKLIALYLQKISTVAKKSNDAWMTRELIIYEIFLLYKENTGIERALGVSILTNKKFDSKLHKKFLLMLANQESSLSLFRMYSDKEAIDFLNKITEDNSFKETERIENIILSGESSTVYNENSEYWLATITKKIDILKVFTDTLSSKIFQHIKERKESMYHNALVVIIIDIFMFLGVIPVMLYVSKRLYNDNKTETKILLQQSKMASIGEMLGAIAHQWRQPLNAVGVLAQEIEFKCEMNVLQPKELKALSNQLLDNLEYMSTTINDFRDFFKPDKEKKVFSVVNAINESLKIISAQLKTNDIEVELVTHSTIKGDELNLFVVNGFESEFKQVIINLLQNAKEAIESTKEHITNKKILITVQRDEFNLEIKIKDNGGGIKKESLETIFDIYVSTKEAQQGTGLGLYMSKLIIERNMQGEILATNKDDGAEFIISLISENIESKEL